MLLVEFELNESLKALEERLSVPVQDDLRLDQKLDIMIDRMNAAKRALGIVNRLPAGEKRTAHRSRVMGNLNTLRAQVNHLFDEMDSQLQ
jgi:hypothetical protein